MIPSTRILHFLFSGENEGKLRKIILSPLCLLSFFYGAGVRLRVLLYQKGFFRNHTLPCKVISVGNLTMGGTGKTPFVAMLAELMQAKGVRTAILSRGYKGSFSGPFGIVTDGETRIMDVRQAGDEPFFLSKKLQGIPILIGKERRLSGQAAVDQFQVQAVILDDGFQHLPLKRDINLLLIDSQKPFGNGRLFPRGTLREPQEQAKRADAVILTKADISDNVKKLKEKFLQGFPGCPVFAARYAPIGIWDPIQGCAWPLGALREKKILAFTGIGNPPSFHRLLENLGARIVGLSSFPDHYWYRPEDFQNLLREGEQKGGEALVTTEKDAVRLEGFPQGNLPLWILSVRHEFIGKEQDHFEQFLWSKLGLGKKG